MGFFFIVFAAIAIFTCITCDLQQTLNLIYKDSPSFLGKFTYDIWAQYYDPLITPVGNDPWYRVLAGASAFVFMPFYFFLIYALIKKKNWIRIPALMYSSAMVYGLVVCMTEEIFGQYATSNVPLMVLAYGPYLVVPILLGIRMRHEKPFEVE